MIQPSFFLKLALFRFPLLAFCLPLSFSTCGSNWLNRSLKEINSPEHSAFNTLFTFFYIQCIFIFKLINVILTSLFYCLYELFQIK